MMRLLFGSTKRDDNAVPSSVLIIGAGVAGLTAGHILEQHGISLEILEASETFGGRLKKTDDFADFPIDLGAEWIHTWIGAPPPLLQAVMDSPHERFPRFLWAFQTASRWKSGRLHSSVAYSTSTHTCCPSTSLQTPRGSMFSITSSPTPSRRASASTARRAALTTRAAACS